jgi:L-fuconolactonase
MIHDLPDGRWMLRTELRWAFDALEELDLVFDALVFPRHLDHLLHLWQRYPALVSIIDHTAKPNIRGREFAVWAAAMKGLARETSACCKLSGLATVTDLRPYADHLLETFGGERLILG